MARKELNSAHGHGVSYKVDAENEIPKGNMSPGQIVDVAGSLSYLDVDKTTLVPFSSDGAPQYGDFVSKTISVGGLDIGTDKNIIVSAESGGVDDLDYITASGLVEGDEVQLISASGHTVKAINLYTGSPPAGNIAFINSGGYDVLLKDWTPVVYIVGPSGRLQQKTIIDTSEPNTYYVDFDRGAADVAFFGADGSPKYPFNSVVGCINYIETEAPSSASIICSGTINAQSGLSSVDIAAGTIPLTIDFTKARPNATASKNRLWMKGAGRQNLTIRGYGQGWYNGDLFPWPIAASHDFFIEADGRAFSIALVDCHYLNMSEDYITDGATSSLYVYNCSRVGIGIPVNIARVYNSTVMSPSVDSGGATRSVEMVNSYCEVYSNANNILTLELRGSTLVLPGIYGITTVDLIAINSQLVESGTGVFLATGTKTINNGALFV